MRPWPGLERSALQVDEEGEIISPEDGIFRCPYDGLPLTLKVPGGGGGGAAAAAAAAR